MNRGIFDSRVRTERPKAPLKATLRDSLGARERRLEDYRVRGFPIFRYRSRERFSMPRILYVGDAAGADPLLGEGISFALAYGEVAAAEIDDAFARMDFGFEGYRRRVLRNSLLRTLPARAVLARLFYRLSKNWQRAAIWRMTPAVVGVYNWYHPDFPRLRLAVEKT